MKLCYIDESGCTGALPTATSPIQPALVIAGLVIDQHHLHSLTRDFLALKQRYFPGRNPATAMNLDWVLVEIKGASVRSQAVSTSRRQSRHALGFMDKVVDLLEQNDAKLIGRVWVKGIAAPFDGKAVYTSSIQSICQHFQHLLSSDGTSGLVIADSRNNSMNANVSHSIFTKRFQFAGDEYPNIVEMPTFGHSENHVPLQLADLVCSALLFPMSTFAYCLGHVVSIHVKPEYNILKTRYGLRLRNLQHRYQDPTGKWRGGITVSDAISQKSGAALF